MKLVVTSLLYVNCCGLLSNVKLIQGVVLRKSRLYCYESECLFSLSVQFVFGLVDIVQRRHLARYYWFLDTCTVGKAKPDFVCCSGWLCVVFPPPTLCGCGY